MSNVVVLTFDDAEQAGRLREELKGLEKAGRLSLDDSAVVVKDAEGKVHVHNQLDRGVKIGAASGAVLGTFVMLMFPLAGLALGAAAGAAVGSSFDLGVDKSFVKEVSEALTPGTSALFLQVRSADRDAALAAVEGYSGKVYQTSLSEDAEERLRSTLEGRPMRPPA